MAANPRRFPIVLSFANNTAMTAVSMTALNAAGYWCAYGFYSEQVKTLAKVRIYVGGKNGTLAATDISCGLWGGTTTGPDSANILQTSTSITAALAANAWGEWTGFSTALAARTQYWLVFKNLNADPATNYPSLSQAGPWANEFVEGTSDIFGWGRRASYDSGATWLVPASRGASLRLEFSDATFAGVPVHLASSTILSGDRVYSARENGNLFTSPADVRLNVQALSFCVVKGGTPTGNLRYRLYTGSTPTLLGTTLERAPASVDTAKWHTLYFSTPLVIEPGTIVRAVVSETTQSDTSTNYYGPRYAATIENDAASKALKPFDGTLQQTYYDGSTWTETDTVFHAFALILDDADPFATIAAGGGISRSRILGGG